MRVALRLPIFASSFFNLSHGPDAEKLVLKLTQDLYEQAYKEGYKDAQQDCAEEEEN